MQKYVIALYIRLSIEDYKYDIGSYIRTVYHMVSHTPKRRVGRSNRLWGAKNPGISQIPGFLFIWRHFLHAWNRAALRRHLSGGRRE